ncbi:RTA1 like protein-domain-containing protein [Microdochium trichocladiopsis]|uniref:RTA1 like protein-domain-containing protein n=1 Tax=Microdochium trichocladiopsis TaxID=1682393 RepID=A0A9P9BWB6_9PEZI|nr:RTA1 like protein-domain-containing protein [Microdochium trichocladiopsis]KAH7041218.1 RTA1 like protein-domain-containing protein [Microdochium trichocladiopsis]
MSCTEVSIYCPVERTVLGYYPNLGANAFLAAGFGACIIGLVATCVMKRTWGYSSALTAGCILEFAGYVARTQLHYNPWNQDAFKTQICAIVLGPTLICVSIYLTLKHVVLSVNPELSRIKPRLYPLIFVPADVSCLILQAIGGGLAAAAGRNTPKLLNAGNNVIITGIALQAALLGVFGVLCTDYFLRCRKWIAAHENDTSEEALAMLAGWKDKKFRMFVYAVSGAYFAILIRCIYRIAEMAGGWGNHIMQDEPSFIVLEGCCILVAVALLTVFPPGFLFPAMAERERARFQKKSKQSKAATGEATTSGDESASTKDEKAANAAV